MKKLILTFGLLSIFSSLQAQSDLPETWIGEWGGELEIHNTSGISQKVEMGLNIFQKTDTTWGWQIIYGTGEEAQLRDYELVRENDSGHFYIDEKNSILLYMSLINNTFYSAFEIQNTQLLVSYELTENEEIIFRTQSFSPNEKKISGGEDGVSEVVSRKTTTSQIATLTRKKR